MLLCVSSVIDHRCGKNKEKVNFEARHCVSLMLLLHFDVFCDLLLNKHNMESMTETMNI